MAVKIPILILFVLDRFGLFLTLVSTAEESQNHFVAVTESCDNYSKFLKPSSSVC